MSRSQTAILGYRISPRDIPYPYPCTPQCNDVGSKYIIISYLITVRTPHNMINFHLRLCSDHHQHDLSLSLSLSLSHTHTVDLYAELRSEDETTPIFGNPRTIQRQSSRSSLTHLPPSSPSSPIPWEEEPDTDIPIYQSSVFIEDGIEYRSIHHRIDPRSLNFYRIYYSRYVQWFLGLVIFVNLLLAFIEYPTSLSQSSDYRYRRVVWHADEIPCGVTETIEILCFIFFFLDCVTQFYLLGKKRFTKKPWLLLYAVMIIISFIDLIVTLSFCHDRDSIGYKLRIRRFFRPLFFLLSSSIMKKYIKAIYLTLPQIFNVLALLLLHIYIFTMIGLLAFPRPPSLNSPLANVSNFTNTSMVNLTDANYHTHVDADHFTKLEGSKYFRSVFEAVVNLTVLLTTANHPDIRMPIYQYNRFSAIYFIAFLLIGAYLIFNLLIAVIYSSFKGFFQKSLQSSFFRRRVAFRAAFTILSRKSNPTRIHGQELVSKALIRKLLQRAKISAKQIPLMYHKLETMGSDCITWKQFCEIFDLISKDPRRRTESQLTSYSNYGMKLVQYVIRHRYFVYFTYGASVVHVILITAELEFAYSYSLTNTQSRLAYYNFFFVLYYVTEQVLKVIFLGRREYLYSLGNLYEGAITLALLIVELLALSLAHSPFGPHTGFNKTYDVLIRTMNIFVVLRLLRLIPHVKSLKLLTATILDLVKNLRGFLGIIVVVYYLFALLGMELFHGVDGPSAGGINLEVCGSYDNLEYYANNFNDFASSLVVLWDGMVVNNWYVYLDKFATDSRFAGWSKLYFIAWWLVSVVICANLFVSLVLDTFLTKWEAVHASEQEQSTRPRGLSSASSLNWDSLSIVEDSRVSQDLQSYTTVKYVVYTRGCL